MILLFELIKSQSVKKEKQLNILPVSQRDVNNNWMTHIYFKNQGHIFFNIYLKYDNRLK